MNRESMLDKVRTALGRKPGLAPAAAPDIYSSPAPLNPLDRVAVFTRALEALAGQVVRCADRDKAREIVGAMIAGKRAVASAAEYLGACGITMLPGVSWKFSSPAAYRNACAEADYGITSADYALADTGTLVMISGRQESRLVSLLPPVHIAVVPVSRMFDGLDQLMAATPRPADITSSMVFITGPSRTADIEQILVRGVHGPGEITVILVDE